MRKKLLIFIPAVFFFWPLGAFPAICDDNTVIVGASDRTIREGDFLLITVMEHKDLCMKVTVDNAGKIAFPLINEIEAKDKTTTEFARALEKRLSEYIRYPIISVSYHNSFYVYGEVSHPGEYELQGNINVLKAIAVSGGFTDFASHRVKIIKSSPKRKDIWVNVDRVINEKNGKGRGDVLIEPGDVVVVNQSLF